MSSIDKDKLVHGPTRDALNSVIPLIPFSSEVIASIRAHGKEYEQNHTPDIPTRRSFTVPSIFPGEPDVLLYVFIPEIHHEVCQKFFLTLDQSHHINNQSINYQSINNINQNNSDMSIEPLSFSLTDILPQSPNLPILYHIHGGGFILGSSVSESSILQHISNMNNVIIIAPEFRLPPEAPFPCGLLDCYSGLAWVYKNALNFGGDPSRIGLQGESSGGCITAALCILSKYRPEQIPICLQLLIMPMLDCDTGRDIPGRISNPCTGGVVWDKPQNIYAWNSYGGIDPDTKTSLVTTYLPVIDPVKLGINTGSPEEDYNIAFACFSPIYLKNYENLPPGFVIVGNVDLFFDETVQFVLNLNRAGSLTELHVYNGAPHVFMLVPSHLTDQFRADMQRCYATRF